VRFGVLSEHITTGTCLRAFVALSTGLEDLLSYVRTLCPVEGPP
jgi:hypothetical protein